MDDKKVDESWKEKATKPKQEEPKQEEQSAEPEIPPANFGLFISSLGMQALVALGEIENPLTDKKEKQLPQAKYLIDTIEMLQEKTKGNLSNEEFSILEGLLYELRMKYISSSK